MFTFFPLFINQKKSLYHQRNILEAYRNIRRRLCVYVLCVRIVFVSVKANLNYLIIDK